MKEIYDLKNVTLKAIYEYKGATHINCEGLTPADLDNFDEVYKECGKKYTPNWLKERNGECHMKSKYNIPVRFRFNMTDEITSAEYISQNMYNNAKVSIRVRQKEGAIYPLAIVVEEIGEESTKRDYFEGL